ncbi:MAG: hypothetical protein LC107_00770 [Chitinophagales bacterium]|nr:hypothetical protein [Chitinophagales bacterium]
MVEKSKANYQSQQHFITDSPWSASDLMAEVAKKVNKDLGNTKLQALNIDENSQKNQVSILLAYPDNTMGMRAR